MPVTNARQAIISELVCEVMTVIWESLEPDLRLFYIEGRIQDLGILPSRFRVSLPFIVVVKFIDLDELLRIWVNTSAFMHQFLDVNVIEIELRGEQRNLLRKRKPRRHRRAINEIVDV